MRISDWSSDVCSSDLRVEHPDEVGCIPYVLILAPADAAVDVPAHQLVHAIARLAHRRNHEPFADHVAAMLVDELDLHMGAPAGLRVAKAPHPRPSRIEAAELAVATNPAGVHRRPSVGAPRSEEHTSELQSLMRISYAVFCLKK